MILIYPPVAKPSEPPAGIGKLAGALRQYGLPHRILDANLEGLLYLIQSPKTVSDRWTDRAYRTLSDNLSSLKNPGLYHAVDSYNRAVMDLNRVAEVSHADDNVMLSLVNYRHRRLSPLRSADLIRSAEYPELNAFFPYFKERLSALLESEKPSVVGFSLNYLSQALCTFAMIGFLRKNFPGLVIVLGGGLVTSWMQRPQWHNPFTGLVDHLFAGPGEGHLLSLHGLRAPKNMHCTPSYDSLPINDYLAPGFILPYSGSRGCPWNRCSFCPERAEKNPYIPVPVKRVMSDLECLVMRMGPVLLHLLDDTVTTSVMNALAGNPFGIPWYGFARITRELTDLDFCTALRRSGCVMLKLGLESGDQGVLDKMRKGIDLEKASLALKTLRKAGIVTYIYLLFGTPWETVTEARNTLGFIARHCDEIGFLNLAIFNMPACSPEAQDLTTRKFYAGDLSLYTDFVHPRGWGRKGVRQFLEREFRRHKAVSPILKKDPPFFTSNHAPFFAMREKGCSAK